MFVDREEELNRLLRLVEKRDNILIYGLRGIGKTALLKELYRRLMDMGIKVSYVDGFSIFSPGELASKFNLDGREPANLILEKFFRLDNMVLILDEFTYMMEAFSGRKPYSRIEDVARHFRSLLEERSDRGGCSLILCSSALGFVSRLLSRYFAPLFRMFSTLRLGPLPLDDAAKLAESYGLAQNKAFRVAELCQGNPYYIIRVSSEVDDNVEVALENLLTREDGSLNLYFSALFERLQPEEKFILHLLARSERRFSEIEEKMLRDPSPYLRKLLAEGLIKKFRAGRQATYRHSDRVFMAWLALQETPSLAKMSFKTIYTSSMGFEAQVREMLREIPHKIVLKDIAGGNVVFTPYKRVIRYVGRDFELDALCINDGATIVEAHFWGRADKKKIMKFHRNLMKAEKTLGIPIAQRIMISYFGFSEDAIDIASKFEIRLLDKRHLREMQRKAGVNWGF